MERERFLDRLRANLATAPPRAGAHPPPPPPATVPRVVWHADPRPPAERFAAVLAALGGRAIAESELADALAELEVRSAVVATDALSLPDAIERLPPERVHEADAGVTSAVAACAVTGTVVLASSPAEPRLVSLLPRLHVVAVARGAVVETPGDVLRDLGGRFQAGLPSALTLVSGPSRSGDIEGEITLGVHGPMDVLAVLTDAT